MKSLPLFLCFIQAFILNNSVTTCLLLPQNWLKTAIISVLISLPSDLRMGVDESGLFQMCPSNTLSCVSSQDDRPAYFLEPFYYDGELSGVYSNLLSLLVDMQGATVVRDSEDQRYLHVRFVNIDKSTDECEFYFTPNDDTIQFRSFRSDGSYDFSANRNRIQAIAQKMHLESVPVLRNRRRAFIFFESPLDTFGPPTILFDKLIDEVSGDQATPPPPSPPEDS